MGTGTREDTKRSVGADRATSAAVVRLLQVGDDDLMHLEHGVYNSFCFDRIGVTHQLAQRFALSLLGTGGRMWKLFESRKKWRTPKRFPQCTPSATSRFAPLWSRTSLTIHQPFLKISNRHKPPPQKHQPSINLIPVMIG